MGKVLSIVLGANSNFSKYLEPIDFNYSEIYYFIYNHKISPIQKKTIKSKFGDYKYHFLSGQDNWISKLILEIKLEKVEYIQIVNLIRYPLKRSEFSEIKPEDWVNSFATDPVAFINLLQKLCKKRVIGAKNLSGSIVCFSSYLGLYGSSDQIPYALSKASLMNFTKCVSPVLIKLGFRINNISFGSIDFTLTKDSNNSRTKLNNNIHVAEVKKVLKFLLSRESSAINGENINLSR